MSQFILKVLLPHKPQESLEIKLSHLSVEGPTQRQAVKAQPGATYRLVDGKTGEVVKAQSVLRKGRTLEVVVENKLLVEIEGFFSYEVDASTVTTEPAQYLISQDSGTTPAYGLILSNTPVAYSQANVNVVWTPDLPMPNMVEAQALGLPSLAALAGGVDTLTLGAGGALGIAAIGGGSGSAVSIVNNIAKITGKVYAGEVISNGNGDLKVQVLDIHGNVLSQVQANNDGSFSLNLDKSYKGVVVLKAFDQNTANTNNPEHFDESTQKNQNLPTLTASFYFDGQDVTIHITPLTFAAALKAGFKADGTTDSQSPPNQTSVESANALMAKAFGLQGALLDQSIKTTVTTTGQINPNANTYGVVLDLLSHMVNKHSTQSIEDVVKNISQHLSLDASGNTQIGNSTNLQVDINQAAIAVIQQNNALDAEVLKILKSLGSPTLNYNPIRTQGNVIPLSIDEDSANATAASLDLSGLDYGPGGGSDESNQTLTYTITNLPASITLWKSGGTQVFSGDTLTLAELQGLMYKTVADANGTAKITWAVTDSGNPPSTLTESLTVTINPVNDAPVRTGTITALTVNEDSANTTAASLGLSALTYSPGGGADEATQSLTYTITSIPSFITLWKAGGTSQVLSGNTLTLTELQGLMYKTVADASGTANITWTVTDNGTSPQTFAESMAFTVTPVNDAPTITGAPSSFTITEDVAGNLTFTGTPFADVDSTSLTITLSVADGTLSALSSGGITLGGDSSARSFSGSAADLNTYFTTQGNITYRGATNVNGTRMLTIKVDDGENTNNLTTTTTTLNITPVNDAPYLLNDKVSLADIAEDTTNPSGDSILHLFNGAFSDANDAVQGGSNANSLVGVALTQNTADANTQGTWQWKEVTGNTWQDIGVGISNSQALYLGADAMLRFLPIANFYGKAPDLIAKLVDNSNSGLSLTTSGTVTDTTQTTDTHFSTSTVTLSTQVTPVNDAPVAQNSTVFVPQNGTYTFQDWNFGFDDEEQHNFSKVIITGLPNAGTLKFNDGVNSVAVTQNQVIDKSNLGGLVFSPAPNTSGQNYATIGFKVQDDGGTANGGVDTSTSTYTITIDVGSNVPPSLVGNTNAVSFTEDGVAQAIFANNFAQDTDNPTLTSATMSITAGFATGQDVLNFSNVASTMGNIQGNYSATTGVLTLTSAGGTATIAQWNAALKSVTYSNSSQNPSTTPRTVSLVVNDGAANSAAITNTINVTAVNDAPVVTGTNTALSYTENDAAKAIFTNLTINDPDNTTLTSATVSITAGFATGQDVLNFTPNSTNFGNIALTSYANGVLTLTSAGGTATLAQWTAALKSVTYNNTSDNPSTTARTVSLVVNDGAANSTAITTTINITAVNDAPVLASPSTTVKAYSGLPYYLPTGFAFNDMDAGNNQVQLTLKVVEGSSTSNNVLTYGVTSGVTPPSSSPNNIYVFQGTLSALRNWLNTPNMISFTPSSGFSGTVTVTATISDGALTSSSTSSITVNNGPALLWANTNIDSTKIALTFNENVNTTTALLSNFTIVGNGTNYAPSSISTSGRTVWLGLPAQLSGNALNTGDVIQVTYTPPTPADPAPVNNAIQDTLGNDAPGFTTVPVTNFRGDTTPPLLQKAELSNDGYRIILTYNELLADVTAPNTAFSAVSGTSAAMTPLSAITTGKNTVTLTFATAFSAAQDLKLTYTAPTTSNTSDNNPAIQDAGGTDAAGFSGLSVFTGVNAPLNIVQNKIFTAMANSQIDLTGLGLSHTLGNTTLSGVQTMINVNGSTNQANNGQTFGTLQLLNSGLQLSGVTLQNPSLGTYTTASSFILTGTESQINTFLSTPGNLKYLAPSNLGTTGDLINIVTKRIDSADYLTVSDLDSVMIKSQTGTGLGLTIQNLLVKQGLVGSEIGFKGSDRILTLDMFDVVDSNLPTGTPSGSLLASYTIVLDNSLNPTICAINGSGSTVVQSNYFYKTSAPSTAIGSFTLDEVANGTVGFYYNGDPSQPGNFFTAKVTTGSQSSSQFGVTLSFITPALSAEGTGGLIFYGDGSGKGGYAWTSTLSGTNGAGDSDTLTGTNFNDVIFGDGSGGGEGTSNSSGGFTGVAGRGGGGNDIVFGGAGDDLMFGDGFAGNELSFGTQLYGGGALGGYGGGGSSAARDMYASPWTPSIGGGTGGQGSSVNSVPTSPIYKGQTNTIGKATVTEDYASTNNGSYLGAPGAGVTANGAGGPPSATSITAFLTQSTYAKVLTDFKNGPSSGQDKRMFTQVMGDGNDILDGGAGNDWIMGGYGNDTITGGSGDDTLWGRGGGVHIVNINNYDGTLGNTSVNPVIPPATEKADVVFADGLKVGESASIGGLSIKVTGTVDMTAAQVAAAFAGLANNATSGTSVAGVTFTSSGSLSGWSSGAVTTKSNYNNSNDNLVTFTSTTANSNITNLTASYTLLDNDTFIWNSNDAGTGGAVDIIKDFNAWNGTSGDKLNITSLLKNYVTNTSTLSQWVTVATGQTAPNGTANSTKITIDVDGIGNGTVTQTIWLEGVNLSSIDPATLKNNGVFIA